MTRPDLRPLIERCAAEAAAKFGARFSDVLGTDTARGSVFARREAIRAVLAASSCSHRALAQAWGIDPQMIRRAIDDVGTIRPFAATASEAVRSATRAKLAWRYGPERAAEICAGTDQATEADIAAWRNLGRRSAA